VSWICIYRRCIASGITKFNQYVKLLLAALHAPGKKTEDLLTDIFKGYLAALDKVFIKYILREQEQYEEETVSIEPDTLMGLADVKFKTLKQKGSRNAPTPEEEKILALQSEVESLVKTCKKPLAAKRGDKPDAGGKDGGKPGWLCHNHKPYHKEAKKPKTWNESKYYWCSSNVGGKCTGEWRTNKLSECKGLEFRNKQSDDAKPKRAPDSGSHEPKKKLELLTKAYSALADQADSGDSE
jgi:hypothetical protein